MLNRWISESELKNQHVQPLEMIKNDQEIITTQPTILPVKRTDGRWT